MHRPRTVDGILKKLKEKADSGEYLYRGEPKHFQDAPYCGKVSSNFYRISLMMEDLMLKRNTLI